MRILSFQSSYTKSFVYRIKDIYVLINSKNWNKVCLIESLIKMDVSANTDNNQLFIYVRSLSVVGVVAKLIRRSGIITAAESEKAMLLTLPEK